MELIKKILNPIITLSALAFVFWSIIAILLINWINFEHKELPLQILFAILTGGVASAIITSLQFSKFFKEKITEAIYNTQHISKDTAKEYWKNISNKLLSETLPNSHTKATDKIFDTFFNDELDFHYKDYRLTYNIKIDKNLIATITNHMETNIELANNADNPTVKYQTSAVNPTLKLLSINEKDITNDSAFKGDINNKIIINLQKYKQNNQTIKLERVIKYKQNLIEDSVLIGTILRYTKGLKVRVKIDYNNYKIDFHTFGFNKKPACIDEKTGYNSWVIADLNSLLLPKQGFAIIISQIISK